MITRSKAKQLRRYIEQAAVSLPDEDALEAVELFPVWAVGIQYETSIRVRYENQLYRCEQTHTSQADWTPDVTKNLWTAVAEPGTIPVWIQPTGAQDAYRIGDKVHYPTETDPVYISVIDYNVYAPDVAGWELSV